MHKCYPILMGLLFCLSLESVRAQEKQDKKKERPMLELRATVTIREHLGNPYEAASPVYEFASPTFELKNVSDKTIEIAYTNNPLLQYLKAELHAANGKVVKYKYPETFGFAPIHPPEKPFALRPGESYKLSVGVPTFGGEGPGVYKVQTVYEYKKIRVVAAPVEFELKNIKIDEKSLVCGIILKKKAFVPGEHPTADFELKNISDKPVSINYIRDPLEHLGLVVKFPPDGKFGYSGDYGKKFDQSSPVKTLTLKPGDAYTKEIGLFDPVPKNSPLVPGVYRILSKYEYRIDQYNRVKAVSPVVEVELKAVTKK